jgi:hypothetical protein
MFPGVAIAPGDIATKPGNDWPHHDDRQDAVDQKNNQRPQPLWHSINHELNNIRLSDRCPLRRTGVNE